MFSTGVSRAQAERLTILMEECGEAIQAAAKILRHGYDSYNPLLEPNTDGNPAKCNRDDLEKELGDVYYAILMLRKKGDVSWANIMERSDEKSDRIKPYLHFQGGSPKEEK